MNRTAINLTLARAVYPGADLQVTNGGYGTRDKVVVNRGDHCTAFVFAPTDNWDHLGKALEAVKPQLL